MVQYDLSHLRQPEDQDVWGPVQDDEALLLYAVVRGMRLNRVLEVGGLAGYSATNFLMAMCRSGPDSVMYTVDVQPCVKQSDNHRVIVKDVRELDARDLDDAPLDLVFYDCHCMVQMDAHVRLERLGLITDRTVIALHDTNLHYPPYGRPGVGVVVDAETGGRAHQIVERHMVNQFKSMGYDAFCLHTTPERHTSDFPIRHGITLMQKFRHLAPPMYILGYDYK